MRRCLTVDFKKGSYVTSITKDTMFVQNCDRLIENYKHMWERW